MGKKKNEEMDQQRAVFVAGAGQNNIGASLANEIFDTMEKFAGYGFNKSHAAAYSLVAYQTAWLKQHHPAAFVAATLSSEMANTDKVQFFYNDAKENGIVFLPPDINLGGVRFQPTDAQHHPLRPRRHQGHRRIRARRDPEGARRGRPLRRPVRFLPSRRQARGQPPRHRSADPRRRLRQPRRPSRTNCSPRWASPSKRRSRPSATPCRAACSTWPATRDAQTHYVDVPRWGEREQLLNEKQALGFFLSGHPYNEYANELAAFVKRRLGQLQAQRDPVLMAGVVHQHAHADDPARQDGHRHCSTTPRKQLEVSVFNELWEAERGKIKEDELLLVEGKVQNDDYSGGLRITADRLLTLGEARGRYAKLLRLAMNGETKTGDARKLQAILGPYRSGACPVRLSYRNGAAEAEIPLPDGWRVNLDDALLALLGEWLSPANVKVVYS